MFNSEQDLLELNIDEVVTVTFQDYSKVSNKYRGKTLKFVINNFKDYQWGVPLRNLALVPIEKSANFKKSDVLFIAPYYQFECLMIDLFPCNRRAYAGWKRKTVVINRE
jgi:hypothetical protein